MLNGRVFGSLRDINMVRIQFVHNRHGHVLIDFCSVLLTNNKNVKQYYVCVGKQKVS